MSKRRRATFRISVKVIKPNTRSEHQEEKRFKPLCGRITTIAKVLAALQRFILNLGDWREVHIIIEKEEGGGKKTV